MKYLVCTLSFLFYLETVAQTILQGRAKNVYDGDTFTLVTDDQEELKIRLVGIDAPEVKQEHGVEARDYARSLLNGKELTVYLEPGETYGRKLGVVITNDGKHFNYEMVAAGYAWFYDYYSDDKYLEAAYKRAKELKHGLWSLPNPVAPWDWRKKN
ncbi:thermonuclease family protein [Ekhidna sp. MALMAid0563]|uniref:thermonuclease family protein n=1 Tax=Ekhidna sp. MALMAid0563 TaxID=3143937 RepID=UPI0032E03ED6